MKQIPGSRDLQRSRPVPDRNEIPWNAGHCPPDSFQEKGLIRLLLVGTLGMEEYGRIEFSQWISQPSKIGFQCLARMKTKGKIESGRNVRVFWDKIEADNSMTLEQGEGRVLKYSLGRKSSCKWYSATCRELHKSRKCNVVQSRVRQHCHWHRGRRRGKSN